jgi:hypothetical protein
LIGRDRGGHARRDSPVQVAPNPSPVQLDTMLQWPVWLGSPYDARMKNITFVPQTDWPTLQAEIRQADIDQKGVCTECPKIIQRDAMSVHRNPDGTVTLRCSSHDLPKDSGSAKQK